MRHSPIQVKKTDGTTDTIMPFARPWINAEEEYFQAQLAKKGQATVTAVTAYNKVALPTMSLRQAFYALYIEPAILAVKMQAADLGFSMHKR